VQSVEKPVDDPACYDLDVAKRRETRGVEEVSADSAGAFHRGGKIML
jgi:hypothetical protein